MNRRKTKKRKTISKDIETQVLTASARRCCLCFGIDQDFKEKKGQIAHLDHDPSNSSFENLAFLCLEHHDRYDSTTRLSKGLIPNEVVHYRELLYQDIIKKREKDTLPQIEGKTYIRFDPNTTLFFELKNISSLTDNGLLDFTITFSEDFATDKYLFQYASNRYLHFEVVEQMKGAIRLRFTEPCPDVVEFSFYI